MTSSSPSKNLEMQLEMLVENLHEIRITAAGFQPQGQMAFNQKVQNVITGLQEINKLKSEIPEIKVPLELFEYIDNGRNPQLYTKDCLERALHNNELVKGKIDALKKFRTTLMADWGQIFPNELNKYMAYSTNCKPKFV